MQLLKKSNDIIMNDSLGVTLSPAWNPVGFISSSNGIGIRLLQLLGCCCKHEAAESKFGFYLVYHRLVHDGRIPV